MPKISVIIPTYNRKELLPRAIVSVFNQTFRDFEIIVVDDASSDGTMDVLRRFHDARLHYIRQKENRGHAAAVNKGIKASKGEFIAQLDDDDEYLPEKLQRQLEVLEASGPDIGLVYTGVLIVDQDGKTIGQKRPSESYWDGLWHRDFIGSTALVRKECFEKVGDYDENLHFYEDKDMWLRISDRYSFAFVKAPLYKVLKHSKKMSVNFELQADNHREFYKKHFFRIEAASESTRKLMCFQYHVQLASLLRRSNHSHEARKECIEAMKLQPVSPQGYGELVLSCLPQRLVWALSLLLKWCKKMQNKTKRILKTQERGGKT